MKSNKSFFQETLGGSPQIKVLDFFISNEHSAWNLMEIQSQAKVGYSTLKILIPELLEKELIVIERTIGKSRMYKINLKNPAVKHLMAFDWSLTKQETMKLK